VQWVKEEIRRTEAQAFDRAFAEQTHQSIRKKLATMAAGDPTGRNDPAVLVLESGVGLTEMYWMAGLEMFSYLLADYPDLVEEWLEARNQAELRRVAAIADPELIPIALTYDDIAYKNGTLFAPAWLRQHWVPRLARLNEAWHARGTVCLFHSDGKLWSILDDLVAAGIDGLNPLEVIAGMSVREVRQRHSRLFLTGGIDVSQLLTYGSPEEVRTVCRQAIADAGGVGYFLGSTTELHPDVRLENAIAMFETAWETTNQHSAAMLQSSGQLTVAQHLRGPV
jgi:uroporphyrinogen decarboxylase